MAILDTRDISLTNCTVPNGGYQIIIDEIGFRQPENNLTMYAGGTEMLRVAADGFYVRGQKIPADGKEAETVYKAFKQWLVWAEMNRR